MNVIEDALCALQLHIGKHSEIPCIGNQTKNQPSLPTTYLSVYSSINLVQPFLSLEGRLTKTDGLIRNSFFPAIAL